MRYIRRKIIKSEEIIGMLSIQYSQTLADYVRFYAPYLPKIGLYHGRIGVLLALKLGNIYRENKILEDSVNWLFESIIDQVDDRLPLGMEDGLVGVAYGISLLNQHTSMNLDLNDVLAEIDSRIMLFDPRRIQDTSFRSGLKGIMAYVSLREQEGRLTSLDSMYRYELSIQMQAKSLGLDCCNAWQMLLADLEVPKYSDSSYEDNPIYLSGGSSYFLLKSYDSLLSHQ